MLNIVLNILLYFFTGLLWKRILYGILYETNQLPEFVSFKEIVITILIWPLSLGVFIITYIISRLNSN